jgi:hypothetical protein
MACRSRPRPAERAARSLHGRGRRRTPVLPARVHGDQPGRSRRDGGHLGPGTQGQPGGNRLPPRLAGEQPAEQLGQAAVRPEDQLGRGRLVGPLPAEVTGDPQGRARVGQRGMRGEAVEDDRVARLVAGRRPAGLGQAERARRPGRPEVTAGLQAAEEQVPVLGQAPARPPWSFTSEAESASSSTRTR